MSKSLWISKVVGSSYRSVWYTDNSLKNEIHVKILTLKVKTYGHLNQEVV